MELFRHPFSRNRFFPPLLPQCSECSGSHDLPKHQPNALPYHPLFVWILNMSILSALPTSKGFFFLFFQIPLAATYPLAVDHRAMPFHQPGKGGLIVLADEALEQFG